jgi:hypothetical protein
MLKNVIAGTWYPKGIYYPFLLPTEDTLAAKVCQP